MRTRTLTVIVGIMVVQAVALVVVAWNGQTGRAQLRAALTDAQTVAVAADRRAVAADARAAALQRQVEALTAACCRPGVDPRTVIVTITPSPQPAARASSRPAPAPRTPRPSPSATRPPSASPSPSPTCLPLPVIGCRPARPGPKEQP